MGDVLRAPHSHYNEWCRHYDRYPPGDWRTHRLLATLIAVMCNAHAGKGARPVFAWHFCPELEPEDAKQERLEWEKEMKEMQEQAEVNRILAALENTDG